MNRNTLMFVVSLAMFMEAIDATIINTAIPVIAQSLHVHPIDLKLSLISYLLSLAIFIPISGWMADKFGIKKIFITAVIIFTLSSIWCGYVQSLWGLIIGRIIQGIGGSFMAPVGRLIILRTNERHVIVTKMSAVIMIASLGLMIGPLLGGFILKYYSWPWIFWVNIPVGVMIVLLAAKFIPDLPKIPVHSLDKWGFVLFGSGLSILTYGLSTFSESETQLIHSFLICALAFLLLFWYKQHSYRKKHPLIKISLLDIRTFKVSVMANLLIRLGFGGIPFILPLLFQLILGFTPELSGLLIAPIALGVLLVKPLSVHILRLMGYKRLLILNTALVSLSLSSFATINQETNIHTIALLTFSYGFLMALQYTGMNSLAYAKMKDEDISSATSIMSTLQQIAQSFGVAIAAILLNFFTYEFSEQSILTLATFHDTFITLSILTFMAGSVFLKMNKDDGEELIRISEYKL